MKIRLSAYWWCQIAGWSAFTLLVTFFYFATPRGIAKFESYSSIIINSILGLFTSHLMRLFIIKAKILNQGTLKQFISIFIITILFSFIYLVFQAISEYLRSLHSYQSVYSIWKDILVGVFMNSVYLGIWNLIYFIYHYIKTSRRQELDKLRLENELVVQQLESEKKLANLEMQVLRVQMNPHFIFNSLNSINRFILQNDKMQASEYLTKFSKLVRMILQQSQTSLIPLENELECLELYLDLEAVRFDHRFDYTINVSQDLDIEVLKVPPLIIQPYAENAIWHGLMNKEDNGHLNIELSQEKNYLLLKIIDDGIGRKAASKLAGKNSNKHKSVGLKITAERIAVMQNLNGAESPVIINDLVNPDGSAGGTEVIIKLPLVY